MATTTPQDTLAVEEPATDTEQVPSPPEVVTPEGGSPDRESVAGESSSAPEQRLPDALRLLVEEGAFTEQAARYLLATLQPAAHFPVDNYRDAARHLRRPFTPEAIRFKVQTTMGDKGCLLVSYIDARLVTERLNLVCPHLWHDEYEALADGLMLCRLTVDGITRTDVGSGYKGKGLYSDAFKRAAVKFGVGQSVYALPQIKLWLSEEPEDKAKHRIESFKDSKGKTQFRITDYGMKKLREGYAAWLEKTGIPRFGDPIDHGDLADTAGEAPEITAAEADPSDMPAVVMPLTDDKADKLRLACRKLYESVPKSKLPKARFESELRQASTKHEDLEAFGKRLEEMGAAK